MGSSSMPPGDGSGLLSRRMSKSMAAVVVVERGTAAAQEGTCLWCELATADATRDLHNDDVAAGPARALFGRAHPT